MDQHHLILLFLQLCAMLAVALVFGQRARRLHFPAVLGELERGHKVIRYDSRLIQHHERIVVAGRCSQTSVSDDMVRQVQAALNGYLQEVFRAFHLGKVLDELIVVMGGQNVQLILKTAQVA
jgi:hypothetical protein